MDGKVVHDIISPLASVVGDLDNVLDGTVTVAGSRILAQRHQEQLQNVIEYVRGLENDEPETPLEKIARTCIASGREHLAAAKGLGEFCSIVGREHAVRHGRPFVKLTLHVENIDAEMTHVPSVQLYNLSTGIDYALLAALENLQAVFLDRGNESLESGKELLRKNADIIAKSKGR